jgi:hypothetical protein
MTLRQKFCGGTSWTECSIVLLRTATRSELPASNFVVTETALRVLFLCQMMLAGIVPLNTRALSVTAFQINRSQQS